MNIQEVRLRLLEKVIESGVELANLQKSIEPLVDYVVSGAKTKAPENINTEGWYRPIISQQECEKINKKYAEILLIELRKKFGSDEVVSVKVNQNGSLSIFASPHCNAAGLSFYSRQFHNFGDWFKGRKISLHITPPLKP